MEQIGKIIIRKKGVNGINVNSKRFNNGINVNNGTYKNPYALDRSKFTPNTPETQLAEQIATSFNDLENYAGFLSVINKIGCERAYALWKSILEEIEEKRDTRYSIRNPARYFMWKYKKGLY